MKNGDMEPMAAGQQQYDAARNAIVALRDDQQALAAELAGQGVVSSADAARDDAPRELLDPAALAESEREQTRQEIARYHDRVDSDTPDPVFADETARQIERSLEEWEFEDARLLESKCGDELCRIELAVEGPGEIHRLIGSLRWNASGSGADLKSRRHSDHGEGRVSIVRNLQ